MTKRTFCGSSNDHETADILNLTTFRWPGSTDAERNQGETVVISQQRPDRGPRQTWL